MCCYTLQDRYQVPVLEYGTTLLGGGGGGMPSHTAHSAAQRHNMLKTARSSEAFLVDEFVVGKHLLKKCRIEGTAIINMTGLALAPPPAPAMTGRYVPPSSNGLRAVNAGAVAPDFDQFPPESTDSMRSSRS
jgi:hypothetical protein